MRFGGPGAMLGVCLLGGVADGILHPDAGLFTGFVKSVSVEIRSLLAIAIVLTTRDAAMGIATLETESAARHLLPVVVHDGARRTTPTLSRLDDLADPEGPGGRPDQPRHDGPLGTDSVVLAAGGSRGIAAEVLRGIARCHAPVIYAREKRPVVGSRRPRGSRVLPPRRDGRQSGTFGGRAQPTV